jgi:3-hydroxyacyl-[acyl-carrier-protein] dehydratase
MSTPELQYPIELEREAIAALLPHRGDIFVCERIRIDGPHSFTGMARWPGDNGLLRGHFPGLPIVPGVMLIETMAQLAGAGLLAGDPYMKTLPEGLVGVLASVRRCVFTHPVLPQDEVSFAISCRQMGARAVQVTAKARTDKAEVAQLEIVMIYTERGHLVDAAAAAGN